ncbi:DUF3006 domain-containing protein [Anaerobacillus sp. CMMVII]|uniref:DUF3006 domain-containing protein n=1 Tax=Anaerobacillus sp. CMMVII TaxID=2755588 RepID=UPI0021B755D3|nr:DUF3006 domain-containing protein [Anaerobacillus sp. CMMVII]MCT8140467.1 DUF3006 domain-containing protein [Anaerobacillus sp. CMMVII]
MKGVIDRIVDSKWAVILVGEEEVEHNVPIDKLPADSREGSIVEVELLNGTIVNVINLPNETAIQQAQITDKMNLLKSRKRSNFKRN